MTSFRMFEIILYSMVSLLPYLGLALYPFEDKFRMSKIKLSGCIVAYIPRALWITVRITMHPLNLILDILNLSSKGYNASPKYGKRLTIEYNIISNILKEVIYVSSFSVNFFIRKSVYCFFTSQYFLLLIGKNSPSFILNI